MNNDNSIGPNETNARWSAAILEIHRMAAQNAETQIIAPDKALWLIENIRIYEFNSRTRATVPAIAEQMGESYSSVAHKFAALEKINVVKRTTYKGNRYIDPSPHLPAVKRETIRQRTQEAIETEILTLYRSSHQGSSGVSDGADETTTTNNRVDQDDILRQYPFMKAAHDNYRAMREEIWERLGETLPRRAHTVLMVQILDILQAVGPDNNWLLISDIARNAKASLAWASKTATEMQRLGILEKKEEAVKTGPQRPKLTHARFDPQFLSSVQARLASYSSHSSIQPSPGAELSSNAPSTSDSLPA